MPTVFTKEFWAQEDVLGEPSNALPAWQQLVFIIVLLAIIAIGFLVALAPFAVAYLLIQLVGLPDNPLVLSLVVVLFIAVYLKYRDFFVAAYSRLQSLWSHRVTRIQR